MSAIHQLLPVYSCGDAIGAAVSRTREMLMELGVTSRVYADIYDPRLARHTRPAAALATDIRPGDTVMYHLSIGSPVADIFARVSARRALVYHNITPPEFFADASPYVRYWLTRGRDDLARLTPISEICIADSEFNATEMRSAGATSAVVIPPPLDLERLRPGGAAPNRPPELIFVGRVAPNKRHDDLLRILAATRATTLPDARLVLVGGTNDTGPYVAALRRLATELGLADAVEFTGALSDADLAERYRRASVFVCASDHEGFCIPLVEAMAFGVPVVAFAAGAVPSTLDGAGVVLTTKDPLVWAEVLGRVVGDGDLRAGRIAAGSERVKDFAPDRIREALRATLLNTIVAPGRDRDATAQW